jgi:hypothetical protein
MTGSHPRRRRNGATARTERAWAAILQRRWILLVGWTAALAILQLVVEHRWLGSWHYIVTGVQVLTGRDPLGLYSVHPELQMGPLTFLLSAPLVLLGHPVGLVAAAVVMEACGLLLLREVHALVQPHDALGERAWLLTSMGVMVGWQSLAIRYGHPDDVLALLAAIWGLRLLRSGGVLRAAALIAVAIDCKPWIAPLAVVLLMAPRRRWLPAAALVVGLVAAVWLPFLLHPGTIAAARFTIAVDPTASIRLLGLADARTPVWCRPAQLVLGAVLVALVARTSRWRAALLAVVAVRLLLDPAAHTYYDAGLLVGACVFDVGAAVPVATLLVLIGIHLPPLLPLQDGPSAVIRLVTLVLLVGLALAVPPRRAAARTPPGRASIVRAAAASGT